MIRKWQLKLLVEIILEINCIFCTKVVENGNLLLFTVVATIFTLLFINYKILYCCGRISITIQMYIITVEQ